MALKILLADDSMTAQNMGKKILSEGGYEVVVVSNGSAALKKIAEQKPDIVLLDIYMPGYSGLEVCERLKSTMETAKVPVLLSVGKLEPFRPEDAVRVRAEGVIIKPFEATELLAVIERAAGHIVRRPTPKPVEQEPEPETYQDEIPQPTGNGHGATDVEMPHELASAPAFAIDDAVSSVSMDSFDTLPADPMPSFMQADIEAVAPSGVEETDTTHIEEKVNFKAAVSRFAGASAIDGYEPAATQPAPFPEKDQSSDEASSDPTDSGAEQEAEAMPAVEVADHDPLLDKPSDGGPITSHLEPEIFIDNPDPGAMVVSPDPNLWLNDSVEHVEMLPELEVTAQAQVEPIDAVSDPELIAREDLMSEVDKFPPIDQDDDLMCEDQVETQSMNVSEAEPVEPEPSAALVDSQEACTEAGEPTESKESVQAEDDFEALVSAALAKFEPEPMTASVASEEAKLQTVAESSWRAEQAALDQAERTLSLEREMQIALAVASGGTNSGISSVAVREPVVAESAIGLPSRNGNSTSEPFFAGIAFAKLETAPVIEAVSEPASVEPTAADEIPIESATEEPAKDMIAAPAAQEASKPLPELAASAVAGALLSDSFAQSKNAGEQERLVEAIGRVLERLKPQIVSELVKELKDEK